jgi:CRP/FNR family transcriptional regulator, cyclic AMP receptor protein
MGERSMSGRTALGGMDDLDGIELLASMAPARRAILGQRCAWRSCRPGEEILARDEPADTVLFIVQGRVRVVDFSISGREVAYAVVGAGGHVGELGVIDGAPRSASVVALDACRLACLPGAAFWELLETESGVSQALLKRLARIIRDSDVKITELATMGAMQRVYRELQRLARPLGNDPNGAVVVENLPTQETLAGRLGTTRETVARVLAQLARAGITERHGRRLTIRRPVDLALLVGLDERF